MDGRSRVVKEKQAEMCRFVIKKKKQLFCANYPALSTMQADLFSDRALETAAQQTSSRIVKWEGKKVERKTESFG